MLELQLKIVGILFSRHNVQIVIRGVTFLVPVLIVVWITVLVRAAASHVAII